MKKGKNVITKSYSLSPLMIKWVEEYAEKSHRTNSQVVQLALELFKNKVLTGNDLIIG